MFLSLPIIDYVTATTQKFIKKMEAKIFGNTILKFKLCNLSSNYVGKATHAPEKKIYGFSSHTLAETAKSVLCKSLHFVLLSKGLDYIEYIAVFERLFGEKKSVYLNTVQNDSIESRLVDAALLSSNF